MTKLHELRELNNVHQAVSNFVVVRQLKKHFNAHLIFTSHGTVDG